MTGRKTINLDTKKELELSLKIQGNIRISILKGDYESQTKTENLTLEIKPMTKNVQNELDKLENKQTNKQTKKQKVLNFVLRLDESWRSKNAPKLSSKCLKDRIYKIKQLYSGDKNQKIVAVLRKLSSLPKKSIKNYTPTRQLSKLQQVNFLAKFLTEKKYLMKTLTFARQKHLFR